MSQEDRDDLLNLVIPFAQRLLAKYGEFFPFGAIVTTHGKKGLTQGYEGSERPPPKEVIDLTLSGMQHEAKTGKIRAAALCVNVRIAPPGLDETDAIRVTLEDVDGEAVNCFLPYVLRGNAEITYGELVAGRANPLIFVSPSAGHKDHTSSEA